jgi:hypothetical protein
MLERDIERKCVALAREHGLYLPKWVSPGNAGVPDRILIAPDGRVAFLEFKRPGAGLSALQRLWQRRLIDMGHEHDIVRDPAQFAELARLPRAGG